MSTGQRKASGFFGGGRPSVDILGKVVGTFVVDGYVGKDSFSKYVRMKHACGAISTRTKRSLSQISGQTYCLVCRPVVGNAKKKT